LEREMSNEEPVPDSNETNTEEAQVAAETKLTVKRFRRKQIAIVGAFAITALLIASLILFKSNANKGKGQEARSTTDKAAQTPTVTAVHVVSKEVDRQLRLPGELHAYQDVALYPKVEGFIEEVKVDRGSVVRRGQLLIRMSAPELSSRTGEAEARVREAGQQRLETEARVLSAREERAEAAANRSPRSRDAMARTPGEARERVEMRRSGLIAADGRRRAAKIAWTLPARAGCRSVRHCL